MMGHNSQMKERIQALAVRYADCDKKSQELNDERADIREEVKDMGLDTKAWQHEINRAKQSLRHKEGYDESAQTIREALGEMVIEDLFEHVIRREREKEEARAAKKADRDAQKAKDDEYRPAHERRPKQPKNRGLAAV